MDMRELFPGHFRPSDEEYKAAWNSAVFVFDANILLNFYRYSEKTASEFFQILEHLRGRIWIPHRVAEEYFANRASVVSGQAQEYVNAATKLEELHELLDNTQSHPFIDTKLDKELRSVSVKLKKELEKGRQRHEQRINHDDVLGKLHKLIGGAIGEPMEETEIDKIITEGETRYFESTPPGYKDSGKAGADSPKHLVRKKFGDLILWKQMIKWAKNFDKDIVLVTNDAKEDWWASARGKTIGLRPELVAEFKSETGGLKIYGYQAARFMDLAKNYFGSTVSDETVQEIRKLRERDVAGEKDKALRDKKSFTNAYHSVFEEYDRIKEEVASLEDELASLRSEFGKHERRTKRAFPEGLTKDMAENDDRVRDSLERHYVDLYERYQAACARLEKVSVLADFMRDRYAERSSMFPD